VSGQDRKDFLDSKKLILCFCGGEAQAVLSQEGTSPGSVSEDEPVDPDMFGVRISDR
jgi:hypothetical protein